VLHISKDKYGWGPLHCAVHHGSEECAKLLLEFGATLALKDHVGKTPLHFAAARNRPVLCDLLIRAGADLNDMVTLSILLQNPSISRQLLIFYLSYFCWMTLTDIVTMELRAAMMLS
jgi:ankyrin repeat protein